MVDILAQPKQFKAELKDKWLDYYQANRSWLEHYMNKNKGWCDLVGYDKEYLATLGFDKDYSSRRPKSYFILGVISVLEPSVKGLFNFIGYSTADSDEMVKALGLGFDPNIELKKRSQQLEQQKSEADSQYLDQIREEIKT
ncbi:MAG: DUF5331 domain-containing protein [Xenococcaceae cyanobacterium MO_188.B32]|nr:DUF5331 domain-containing protein [Xenococcaceae cyanobacterium MO_188.B32]